MNRYIRLILTLGATLLALPAHPQDLSNASYRDFARQSAAIVVATTTGYSPVTRPTDSVDLTPGDQVIDVSVNLAGDVARLRVDSVYVSDGAVKEGGAISVFSSTSVPRILNSGDSVSIFPEDNVARKYLLFLSRPIRDTTNLVGTVVADMSGGQFKQVPFDVAEAYQLTWPGLALEITPESQSRIGSIIRQVKVRNDLKAPIVSISAPPVSSWLRGKVDVAVSATDDLAVASLKLFVDGVAIGPAVANPTDAAAFDALIAWDTKTIQDGSRSLTAGASDVADNAALSAPVQVVVDNTAPTLSVSMVPSQLWPPNKKMVTVKATVQAGDGQDSQPTVKLVSVTCNDGCNPAGDIMGAPAGSNVREFQLRSDRSGSASGRTYTITYSVTDKAGNTATAQATVVVPHDQGT
jgi:hypothetical protein